MRTVLQSYLKYMEGKDRLKISYSNSPHVIKDRYGWSISTSELLTMFDNYEISFGNIKDSISVKNLDMIGKCFIYAYDKIKDRHMFYKRVDGVYIIAYIPSPRIKSKQSSVCPFCGMEYDYNVWSLDGNRVYSTCQCNKVKYSTLYLNGVKKQITTFLENGGHAVVAVEGRSNYDLFDFIVLEG